ncbi:uncharacterized protein EKO05_0011542 [Ascochyta rabiei]|uniref:Uncharacterized protein n=1 Tax=Didymella rabiei TaxID=5454 RepID=A0A163AKI2_DIDRA|nr:uncharacterized protein EKO05_0011542 [Ascochyta rabiei]KZM21242.1 hypothetical protein ST47_g7617 [Ascochyta rabiei]UPX21356.1 hypothetical protein EKO05_0011542 [Ascochyta rabiei]
MVDKTAQHSAVRSTTPSLQPPFASRPLPQALTSSPTSSQHAATTNHQPVVFDTSPLSPLDSLPTIAGRGNEAFLANDDVKAFLREDLDLSRLNTIHAHLWMAGRPMRARPLHRYNMYGYEVLGTQQMDLHLLRFSNKLLVKPLPEYLVSTSFWEQYVCADEALWESATGWLLSYVWLITSPLDLKLAHDNALLPAAITWPWWKALVADFHSNVDINTLHQVNQRYHFGDLRLSRINSIYRTRFFFTHFVRGYLYGYNRYVVFFERNFSWILILFVFLSLVLSAMQVGTALEELSGSKAFMKGSYGVVVLSMVSVVVVLGAVGLCFVGIFLFNMVSAVRHAGSEERKREKLRRQKQQNDKEV